MMTPLRIDFTLASPMLDPTYPIHFDGLLAWAAVDEAIENEAAEPILAQEHLPLERAGGVWCASALLMEASSAPHTIALTKTTKLEAFAEAVQTGVLKSAPNKLNLNSGPWRQALFFQHPRHVASATAYCIGETERVARLVQRLQYLGAKRRQGYGRIRDAVVTEDAAAAVRWRERILSEPEDDYLPLQAVTTPPYWDRSRMSNAWVHPSIV